MQTNCKSARLWITLFLCLLLLQCMGDRNLIAINVTPATQGMNGVGETAQFTAEGLYTHSPTTQDITKQVTWASSDTNVATINSTGLATGAGFGTTTIGASSQTGANHSLVVGQATLTVGAVPTLTVVKAGGGSGVVTSTPAGINCGQSCTAPFPITSPPTTVTLTAVATTPSTFGNWSGCDSTSGNICTVIFTASRTVTATFN